MSKGKYTTALNKIDLWCDGILTGTPPRLFRVSPVGTDVGRMEVGPGLVTLIGGAPGAGKTAFTMQLATEALRFDPDLRILVCNVEMTHEVLLDRQLARLSGIDLTTIRHRALTEDHADRIDIGLATLSDIAGRMAFLDPPFNLDNVAAAADDFEADMVVLDYIQRIAPPHVAGVGTEARGSVNKTMDYLRQFAGAGIAVVVVSAVGRSKDSKGRSSYGGDGLNLASFRESSELEFGADDAYILHTVGDRVDSDMVRLKHLKSRHGECRSFSLPFDRRHQSFGNGSEESSDCAPLTAGLNDLWDSTPAADDGEVHDD